MNEMNENELIKKMNEIVENVNCDGYLKFKALEIYEKQLRKVRKVN